MEKQTEVWTCHGRALDTKGKLIYIWVSEKGEDLAYAKLNGRLGHTYDVQVLRDGDSVKVYPDTLHWRKKADLTEEELLVLTARDESAVAEKTRQASLTKAQRDPQFPELFRVLKEASTRMTRLERRALAVRIMEELLQ